MKGKNVFNNFALVVIVLLIGTSIVPIIAGNNDEVIEILPSLHRGREGETSYNPDQPLDPYMIRCEKLRNEPNSGIIQSPPQYEPVHGVIFRFHPNYPQLYCDLIVNLTKDDQYDEIAYVLVPDPENLTYAYSLFTSNGANMSKVTFILVPTKDIWVRDYTPKFIWQNGALAIVDSSYYYWDRYDDDFIPTILGDDYFHMPTYDMGLDFNGGNFLVGPNRSGFVTTKILDDNTLSEGFDVMFITELLQTYLGIDTLHLMPRMPSYVDGTGDIDMWMSIVDENTVIISQFIAETLPPYPDAVTITNNAVSYMENLGFTVYRTPAWNAYLSNIHYTYTNAFRVNNRIFIPSYGSDHPEYLDKDAEALTNWSAAAGPDVEIIPIDSNDIIHLAGVIQCITMQVPRYTEQEPAVHVIWPKGGELLVSGTTQTIEWVATDTHNARIPQIELYYSIDNGTSYNYITTTIDTGFYDWNVPDLITEQAKIKVIAISADSDQGIAESTDVFQISIGPQTIYNFSINASIDRFGWGYQTYNWNTFVDQIQNPVTIEINQLVNGAYDKIAYSDATGDKTDPNRYISLDPDNYYESTHTFEFTINEDPAVIDDIKIHWEGYADDCTRIELYIWDYVEGNWGNGNGLYSQNRFMDNWAGNRDGILTGTIRSNFNRYINQTGQMRILIYAERRGDQTFHDYLSVTVSDVNFPPFIPTEPYPLDGGINVSTCSDLSWTGGDPDNGDTVTYEVYFGTSIPPPYNTTINVKNVDFETRILWNPGTMQLHETYYWKIIARDNKGLSSEGPIWHFTTGQSPPNIPSKPSGPSGSRWNMIQCPITALYSTSTTDADQHDIYYNFSWGDGTFTGWIGPYSSGEICEIYHTWLNAGVFEVKVRAKDELGDLSDWSPALTVYLMKFEKYDEQPKKPLLPKYPG